MRVAAVSAVSILGNPAENTRTISFWAQKAAEEGADMVLFPEMGLTGYSASRAILEHAIPLSAETVRKVQNIAAREGVLILFGFAEKKAGQVFAAQVAAYPDGRCGIYRKNYIAPVEKEVFSPGNLVPVFTYKGFSFGIQLCYDAHFPELSTLMTGKGAEILFIPHASPRGTPEEKHASWMRHLPARAYDNSVYVVAVNPVGYYGNQTAYPGVIMAFDPLGNLIEDWVEEKPVFGKPAHPSHPPGSMVMVEISRSRLMDIRGHRMRHFFPNRRQDIVQALLDLNLTGEDEDASCN